MSTKQGCRQQVTNMDAESARLVTGRIVASLTQGYDDVLPEILAAFRGRAWVALEFTSWEAYCRENFTGEGMLRLPDDMVTALAGEGLSVRAIAAATNRSKSEVHRAAKNATRPDNVTSLDGYRRPARMPSRAESMAVHPAGKRKPVANCPAWEMVMFTVADAGETGATYVDVCDSLGWRDGKVTGALSECSRRGVIAAKGERSGNVVWVAVPE